MKAALSFCSSPSPILLKGGGFFSFSPRLLFFPPPPLLFSRSFPSLPASSFLSNDCRLSQTKTTNLEETFHRLFPPLPLSLPPSQFPPLPTPLRNQSRPSHAETKKKLNKKVKAGPVCHSFFYFSFPLELRGMYFISFSTTRPARVPPETRRHVTW